MIEKYNMLISGNKETVNSLMQLNAIFVSGWQEINNEIFALAQSAMGLNIETSQAAMGIKSPQELTELQSKWAQQFVETVLSGAARLSEISTRIASQAAEPVQSHIDQTVRIATGNTAASRSVNKAA